MTTLNETIIAAAKIASAELARAGIPHALCGGLAVAFYGYPRMTVDVDFAVGDEAFIFHSAGLVTLKVALVSVGGVAIDFIAAPFDASAALDGVPVVSIETLVLMKLRAGRARDISDLVELLKRGAIPAERMTIDEESLKTRWARVQKLAAEEAD